jgi:GT2 family glycosyltransferase
MKLEYGMVIATHERAAHLAETLEALERQARLPARIVVVDSSKSEGVREVAAGFESRLPILYERALKPSAAIQRNQGAAKIAMPVIAFMDDDITLHPGACERICEVFDNDAAESIGGVSARIVGSSHPVPRGLLRWYYRLQAGYSDETYGARLFGPAINCFPCYERTAAELIPADWLNSACVFYRTPVFLKEQFPAFDGYSYMEDVHLSARIAKTHRLFFHAGALCDHRDGGRGTRSNAREIARMRIRNQRRVALEVLDCSGPGLELKLFLQKMFSTIAILRRREPVWWEEIAGTWSV